VTGSGSVRDTSCHAARQHTRMASTTPSGQQAHMTRKHTHTTHTHTRTWWHRQPHAAQRQQRPRSSRPRCSCERPAAEQAPYSWPHGKPQAVCSTDSPNQRRALLAAGAVRHNGARCQHCMLHERRHPGPVGVRGQGLACPRRQHTWKLHTQASMQLHMLCGAARHLPHLLSSSMCTVVAAAVML
jgi:hypothetical protein